MLACAIATALGCGSESEPDQAETTADTKTGAAPALEIPDDGIVARRPPEPPAPEVEEMRWLLSLAVGGAQEIEVLTGTPLLFAVSLTGAGAGPPGRLGAAEKPWHAHVLLERAESGEAGSWQAVALAPHSLVFDADGARDETAPEALVEADRVHLVTLAIAPEAAAQISAGRYALGAVVVQPGRSGEAARVVSESVAVVVREAVEDPATQAALERRRALGEADFYLRARRFKDAQRAAARLVASDRADASAHMLLGDALAGLQQYEQARGAYRAALGVAGRAPNDEPPQALFDRLYEVAERLAPPEPEDAR